MSLDPTQRFTSRVSDYAKYRPGYPPALLHALHERAGLSAGQKVADVGAGTGIFSRLLAEFGCDVFGVEPNAAMRDAAAASARGLARFHPVDGSAEKTTLPAESVDWVTAAQAFHWFDRPAFRAECVRILKPEGYVALVWNDRLLQGSPFLLGYEQLLHDFSLDYTKVRNKNIADTDLAKFFDPAEMDKVIVPSEQRFDFDGLRGRLCSSSYTPQPDHPKFSAMMASLRKLFDRTNVNGQVVMAYETVAYYGQLRQSAASLFGR
jgi:SAM-dependent methyltransferase